MASTYRAVNVQIALQPALQPAAYTSSVGDARAEAWTGSLSCRTTPFVAGDAQVDLADEQQQVWGAPEGVEVLQLGKKELEEGEDDGPPGQRAGAVHVCAPRTYRLVHCIVARAAVHRLCMHQAVYLGP